jgi:hypothetical protein
MHNGRHILFLKILILAIICSVIAGVTGRKVYGFIHHLAKESNLASNINDELPDKKRGNSNLKVVINRLPKMLSETSGLIYFSGGLWTHNDSGGRPEIYKIDTVTGQIEQTITVENAINIDWEDISQDKSYIYIGDFGNNAGNRHDLTIYRIAKKEIPDFGNASVMPKLIDFSYSDQTDFSFAFNRNNYDCEAMLSAGDSLYLFSKRWLDHKSMMYVLPKTPGIWIAQKRDSLDAHGLITGADICKDFKEVALIGYNKSTPMVWLLYDFRGLQFLKGSKQRVKFHGQTGAQTESIAYSHGRNLFISSERTPIYPSRLYKMNTSPWTSSTKTSTF